MHFAVVWLSSVLRIRAAGASELGRFEPSRKVWHALLYVYFVHIMRLRVVEDEVVVVIGFFAI